MAAAERGGGAAFGLKQTSLVIAGHSLHEIAPTVGGRVSSRDRSSATAWGTPYLRTDSKSIKRLCAMPKIRLASLARRNLAMLDRPSAGIAATARCPSGKARMLFAGVIDLVRRSSGTVVS